MTNIDTRVTQFSKWSVLFLILANVFFVSAQEKGIEIENNFTHRKIFYRENTRLKVRTKDGKKHIGKYTIIDDETIAINGTSFPLNDIVKIKRRTVDGEILRPMLIVVGGLCLTGAIAGAAAGGYGFIATVALTPPGLGMLVPVALTNDHIPSKWKYTITTRNDSK
ncbi:hypothetical protein [Flavobacterium sp.]|uniref:hypothetical protein n=1 Tax=Flavobacterium sp. TaxID=239 RepID=UPI002631AB66|nr:hypothetical protein [Flavobacterium sp.]